MNSLRFALRQLRQKPGFTCLAALSFALGIGLVSTQFSLIDGVLLRGLPVPEANRLLHIARVPPQAPNAEYWETFPHRDFLAIQERQRSFALLAGVSTFGANLSGGGRIPTTSVAAMSSSTLLETLGGTVPTLGRWFTAAEDKPGQPLLIVLSHGLWTEEFNSDAGVLGRPLTVNGEPGTIVGVMPAGFSFPGPERIWTNLRPTPMDPRERPVDRVEIIGRLRPDASRASATAELNALAAELVRQWPETNQGYDRLRVEPIQEAYSRGPIRRILYLMLAMTGLILLLACVNVANMLLGRTAQRLRELAVRAAVGASRARLIRQLLGEALLLALVGAGGGIVLASFGVDMLQRVLVEERIVPGWFDFRLDDRVAAVAVGATVIAGLLAGVVPALQASRVDLNTALKDDSRAASGMGVGRLARWLVTAQIAFTAALLVTASALAATVFQSRSANVRYDPDTLLTGRIELHEATHPTPEARARFYRELMTRLAAEPGVEAVAVSSRNLIGSGVTTQVGIEGQAYAHDNARPQAFTEVVSQDYFRLLGIPLLRGRLFDQREHAPDVRAAVVNEAFAQKFWPGEDSLGRRFKTSVTDDHWVTVVGVVPDLGIQGVFAPPDVDAAGYYLAQEQMGWGWLDLFVRTKADPSALVPAIRRAVAAVDPNQPIDTIGTLSALMVRAVRGFTIIGSMAAVFAAITLFLGAVGVYGVTSLAISRRTREFGIRMALGATVSQVLGAVMRQGGRQIGLGLLVGLGGGYWLTRPLQSALGPMVTDNLALYALVAALIAAVGLCALWLPARRASRIDPMVALRSE
ncbi:MAG TPA: ABC transporter permease [Opitutaceae bacterium]|nr:ABC transporter permease [Opitutaceae bacterium]